MCSAIDNEIKHINNSLQDLAKGMEKNNEDHITILTHVAVSVERWEEQKKLNDRQRDDIDRIDRRDKFWNGANSVFVAIAAALGLR